MVFKWVYCFQPCFFQGWKQYMVWFCVLKIHIYHYHYDYLPKYYKIQTWKFMLIKCYSPILYTELPHKPDGKQQSTAQTWTVSQCFLTAAAAGPLGSSAKTDRRSLDSYSRWRNLHFFQVGLKDSFYLYYSPRPKDSSWFYNRVEIHCSKPLFLKEFQ